MGLAVAAAVVKIHDAAVPNAMLFVSVTVAAMVAV